jgi:putative sigma-54 modulation protein
MVEYIKRLFSRLIWSKTMALSIVDRNKELSNESREQLERRLSFALSRFDSRIRQVSVVIEDVNGPRGGIDKLCRIIVKLQRATDVIISDQDSDIAKCIARAADRAGRSVARAIERTQQIYRPRPLDIDSA